jgi:hypothetical protein
VCNIYLPLLLNSSKNIKYGSQIRERESHTYYLQLTYFTKKEKGKSLMAWWFYKKNKIKSMDKLIAAIHDFAYNLKKINKTMDKSYLAMRTYLFSKKFENYTNL